MSPSIRGQAFDATTGEPLASPDVRLYRTGIPDETLAALEADGRFSFEDLSPGHYQVAVYSPLYLSYYEKLTLHADQPLRELRIACVPGLFLHGRVVDEAGRPPHRCSFTLLREEERKGRRGYIRESGDHRVAPDGSFRSPPLPAGTYLLRLFGILQKPLEHDPAKSSGRFLQERVFDFLYPNARDVKDALPLPVHFPQQSEPVHIVIPRPAWYTVRGVIRGSLPADYARCYVGFTRDFGTLDSVGGGGGPQVQPDGSFMHMAQPGRYTAEICEFSPPDADQRIRTLRTFGSTSITVENQDIAHVEVPMSALSLDLAASSDGNGPATD